MRNDVHLAALKAAARVAFSIGAVALANGCSSSDGAESSEETASNESEVKAKAPCHEDAGPAPKKPTACEALLSSTFPVPGDYQWEPVAQSADVVACCDEELNTNGSQTAYRWDCCVAFDPKVTPPEEATIFSHHAMACTPWGPPVPPSMDRVAARRAARKAREIIEAAAAFQAVA